MDFQIKLFSWPDKGDHLIMITRGLLDRAALKRIFEEVTTVTQPLQDCKVIIDLQDTVCDFRTAEIENFAGGLKPERWPATNKVAIVSPHNSEHDQLLVLTRHLAQLSLKIALFTDSKSAVNWLTETV
ncbi:MAG TPA: hypothetical protein VJ864_07235 [Candidatus Binatia bacterium]|jgi:hypothetical protein|nr:hypothetical protein [Candidatus Binatia bacterium]